MNINKVKEYGEFVEIAAPVERTTAEEYPTVLGGEIWYNKELPANDSYPLYQIVFFSRHETRGYFI